MNIFFFVKVCKTFASLDQDFPSSILHVFVFETQNILQSTLLASWFQLNYRQNRFVSSNCDFNVFARDKHW
jgi:hypothetical protein